MATISIVFRGLLVFNKERDRQNHDFFEIGILDEKAHHVPRIMKFRNGVLEETTLLRELMNKPPVLWDLVVDQPVGQGITTREHGRGPINRMTNETPEDDFRWMLNLENNEFPYGNIDHRFGLDRSDLKHVVRVSSGEFYTKLKSKLLTRREVNGTASNFGSVAGVTACDIAVNGGGAKLIGNDPNKPIFEFESKADVRYEFSNSPPDTAGPADHFPHYYAIFRHQPGVKFEFEKLRSTGGASPSGPNPALCGKIYLGEFNGSLIPS